MSFSENEEAEWKVKKQWRQRPMKVFLDMDEFRPVEKALKKFNERVLFNVESLRRVQKMKKEGIDENEKHDQEKLIKKETRKEMLKVWVRLIDELKVLITNNGKMGGRPEGILNKRDTTSAASADCSEIIDLYIRLLRDKRIDRWSRFSILKIFHESRMDFSLSSESICDILPLFIWDSHSDDCYRSKYDWNGIVESNDRDEYYNMLRGILSKNCENAIQPVLCFIEDQVKNDWILRFASPKIRRNEKFRSEQGKLKVREYHIYQMSLFFIEGIRDVFLYPVHYQKIINGFYGRYKKHIYNSMLKLSEGYNDDYNVNTNYMIVKYVKERIYGKEQIRKFLPHLRKIYHRLKGEGHLFHNSNVQSDHWDSHFPSFGFLISRSNIEVAPDDELIRKCECCGNAYLFCSREKHKMDREKSETVKEQAHKLFSIGKYEEVVEIVSNYLVTGYCYYYDSFVELRFHSYCALGKRNLAMMDYYYLDWERRIDESEELLQIEEKAKVLKEFLYNNDIHSEYKNKEPRRKPIKNLCVTQQKTEEKECLFGLDSKEHRENVSSPFFDNSSECLFYPRNRGIVWFNIHDPYPMYLFDTEQFSERMKPTGGDILFEPQSDQSRRFRIPMILVLGPFLIARIGESGEKTTIVVAKWTSPDCSTLIEDFDDFHDKRVAPKKESVISVRATVYAEGGNICGLLQHNSNSLFLFIRTHNGIQKYKVRFGEEYDSKSIEKQVNVLGCKNLYVSCGSVFCQSTFGIIEYDSDLEVKNTYTTRLNEMNRNNNIENYSTTSDAIYFLGCTRTNVIASSMVTWEDTSSEIAKVNPEFNEDFFYEKKFLLFSREKKGSNLIRSIDWGTDCIYSSSYPSQKIGRFFVLMDRINAKTVFVDCETGDQFEIFKSSDLKDLDHDKLFFSFDKRHSDQKKIRLLAIQWEGGEYVMLDREKEL